MSRPQETNFAIHAAGSAMLDLQMAVLEGVDRRPGQKFEVGGLLLGSTGRGVQIDAIQPLAIEYRFGPSFWLSSADVEKWKQSIEQFRDGPKIIGHFRSQRTGGSPLHEAAPQDVDHALADLLQVPDPLLLLVPLEGKNVNEARVYRRHEGIWVEVHRSPIENLRALPAPTPVPPPAPGPILAPHPPATAVAEARPPARRRAFVLLCLTMAALFVLAALMLWRRPAPPAGAASPIGLTAHATIGGIAVGWNRDSALVKQSTSGTLTIHDGDSRQQLTLDRNQLLDGSAVYVPRTGQVDFRLEIYRDRDHFSGESLSVATGITPSPVAPPAPTTPAQAPTVRGPSVPLVSRPLESGSSRASVRNLAAPTQPKQSPVVITPPQISPSAAGTAGNANALQALPGTLSAPLPPAAPPARTPNAATPAQVTSITFVSPVPSRRVNPSIPQTTRSLLERIMPHDTQSIDIRVQIEPSGAVSSATPVGDLNPAQKLLAPWAVQAARLWRFEPARRNGQPMASDYVLTFVFNRH